MFCSHYQNAADLHIGLTDSKGEVYEFDRSGLHLGTKTALWSQCLAVPIVTELDLMWKEYWDYTLKVNLDSKINREDNDHFANLLNQLLKQVKACFRKLFETGFRLFFIF